MKIPIKSEYALLLLGKVNSLKKAIGNIPNSFRKQPKRTWQAMKNKDINELIRIRRESKSPQPENIGFDVNQFLVIFDKLKLQEGYILDYAYYYNSSGGEPLVYARSKDGARISSDQFISLYGFQAKPYLSYIIIDKNPESFFQLVVFSQVVNQFYLFWHALYNDLTYIFDRQSTKNILQDPQTVEGKKGITNYDKQVLYNLSYEPTIDVREDKAIVRCVMFSKWSGFFYQDSTITWPKISIENNKEIIVPYNCGWVY